MKLFFITLTALLVLVSTNSIKAAEIEFSLFEPSGKPVAYIAPSEEMTIYLWSGEPVAYVDIKKSNGPHIYGFNGNHLGWFEKGAIFDQEGKVACANKEMLSHTDFEAYKSYKKYKPYKSYQSYPPTRPYFVLSASSLGCALLLANGQN